MPARGEVRPARFRFQRLAGAQPDRSSSRCGGRMRGWRVAVRQEEDRRNDLSEVRLRAAGGGRVRALRHHLQPLPRSRRRGPASRAGPSGHPGAGAGRPFLRSGTGPAASGDCGRPSLLSGTGPAGGDCSRRSLRSGADLGAGGDCARPSLRSGTGPAAGGDCGRPFLRSAAGLAAGGGLLLHRTASAHAAGSLVLHCAAGGRGAGLRVPCGPRFAGARAAPTGVGRDPL